MARLPRLVIPNQPFHIMHRGNNRQNIFENDDDMMRLKDDLAQALSSTDQKGSGSIETDGFFISLIADKRVKKNQG